MGQDTPAHPLIHQTVVVETDGVHEGAKPFAAGHDDMLDVEAGTHGSLRGRQYGPGVPADAVQHQVPLSQDRALQGIHCRSKSRVLSAPDPGAE